MNLFHLIFFVADPVPAASSVFKGLFITYAIFLLFYWRKKLLHEDRPR